VYKFLHTNKMHTGQFIIQSLILYAVYAGTFFRLFR